MEMDTHAKAHSHAQKLETNPLAQILLEDYLLYGLRIKNAETVIDIKDKIENGAGNEVLTYPYPKLEKLNVVQYNKDKVKHDSTGKTCCVAYVQDTQGEIVILMTTSIGYSPDIEFLVKTQCKDKVNLECSKDNCIYRGKS